jgi:signal transduction histidine kinase
MFRSLRFRLPALFLAGLALAGLVSTIISIGLFREYTEDRLVAELRREARGLSSLYAEQARNVAEAPEGQQPVPLATRRLEQASGSRIFYAGTRIFYGQPSGLRNLPHDIVPWRDGEVRTFEFTPPGAAREYLAVSSPLRLGPREPYFGALVVAKPRAELRDRWLTLIERLALAGLAGIAVAAALAWYVTRKITEPVESLAEAADQIAEGKYDVELPSPPSGDEIGHLASRFGQMAERLQEAEELERNFLMTVSHELRTPLTAIRGHVDALREGVAQDEASRRESLEVIAAEARRLERLVGDVLDLAKLDTRRFTLRSEEVDMARLLERAYTAFSEEARRRGIDYQSEINAHPVIVADGDRVLQIISNLLSNAFRWTPDGGQVGLELDQANGLISVAVQDTGPGIPEDERDRIFRPFWSRDGGGTGLGLAIARELATAHGGHIDLESEPGRGSRFELVLPVIPGDGGS